MGASSVTGTGLGASGNFTTKELGMLAKGPTILISGYATCTATENMSPPSGDISTVVFPTPLPGDHSNYVVMLTTINGGEAYVTNFDDSNGFVGFSLLAETECEVMYMVSRVGIKVNL